MARKRCAKKSGYVTPDLTISKKDLISENLFVNEEYNDWEDYRDGLRDWFSDFKLIKKVPSNKYSSFVSKRLLMNKKQKFILRRRKKKLDRLH